MIEARTLTDGGQTAEEIAAELVTFLEPAKQALDIAIYDVRLPGPVGDTVRDALRAAAARGVKVRIAYNADDMRRVPVPPPPRTDPDILGAIGVPVKPIPGEPDLMHHKFVVRDSDAVWTGSMNWTLDSWTREENVILRVLGDPAVASQFEHVFSDLWDRGKVEGSGSFSPPPGAIRPWFCPGRGEQLAHRIAGAIGQSRRRVRIASPVLTSGPILGTLNEVLAEGRVDVQGVCDATQVGEVFHQWEANGKSNWKAPLLQRALAVFHGKRSTPYRPGAVHDYMHAKVTVCDDLVFCGSFNLSRSGELNAENVLEIKDAALADRLASYIDGVRARYAAMP
jgi:phosphatidylserine/phosphatidylglycerophosphate/cardiolipin synthase-like enzyme